MAVKRDREQEKDEFTLDLVSSLVTLSNAKRHKIDKTSSNRAYVCKTCNREFSSFQALGGHRASHNKVKLVVENGASLPAKAKAHECPICGIEFTLGQALGGHMRRHREFMMSAAAERVRAEAVAVAVLKKSNSSKRVVSSLNLDLSLAPPGEEGRHYDLTKLQLIV